MGNLQTRHVLFLTGRPGVGKTTVIHRLAPVRKLLTSPCLVVATIALRGGGFIAEVKQRTDVEQWEVTLKNREELPERALAWLRAARGPIPAQVGGHDAPH
ncbi:NTPase [Candidatus Methylomirabilis lanthanidiphila]|uniref:NTPase n=1 Tax=Candidatus Methylomirabilis lanthanidiphila TaxID=2211376 RepID=A0A564ZL82_9BACT|nr:hypothetical protein [Candidatus Methylomirabilis lanthanidiphila]VUZ85627.1 NTPase [Candidatus Methylomirabilis lanthanidiphila]